MTRSQLIVTAACAALSFPVFGQKTACDMVTQPEAATILATSADKLEKHAAGALCTYTVKGSTISLIARISPNPSTSVESRKKAFTKMGGTATDEPSLGPGAYSATRPGTARTYAPKGEQMFRIEYVDPSKGKVPDGILDRIRAAVKKALTRL